MNDSDNTAPQDELAELMARREKRKTDFEAEGRKQTLTDMLAIDEAEQMQGDNKIAVLEFDYIRGLPTRIAVRAPTDAEIKRYRSRVQKRDATATQIPLRRSTPRTSSLTRSMRRPARCSSTRLPTCSPKMIAERPGMKVQIGVTAIGLSTVRAEAAGKG
jgi:hypothetical protein